MTIKIVFFGNRQAGKKKLINRLFHPEIPKDFTPTPTPGFTTERVLAQNVFMEIWDLSGEERYRDSRELCYQHADLAIYCVDLSSAIDHDLITQDVQNFRKINEEATLILVGTNADLDSNAEIKFRSINNNNFYKRYTPSTDKELVDFLENLGVLAKQSLARKIKTLSKYELERLQVDLFEQAKNYLPINSAIYEAIDSFMESVHHLSKEKYFALSKEVFLLIDACCHENKNDIPNYIEIFNNQCNTILEHKIPYVENTILALAAAIFVTFIVGALGFGIGFAAGAWAGPLAFLAAIATSYAAISVVAVSGSFGLAAGILTAYGLFTEKKPDIGLLNDIVEAAPLPMI